MNYREEDYCFPSNSPQHCLMLLLHMAILLPLVRMMLLMAVFTNGAACGRAPALPW